ncbi:transcription termination/antitermination NusG family protein [Bacteroides helcogenes]|uniref:NGN domain-containing protein n=1 Tax=Bacteroides helcogenes (strain ATCC 35417 / DSM 20613 / JCM 6297 / CCUG 15421 / P 36-108) TaxID=693979 RepID=E6SPS8_BACT6|nr:transcription termination/antitermination NusG family protein [Bacteroides helcogenes]ADV44907.1 NGN domain-containing protein [Bacteroides helcogenes P 36-108]
MNDNMQKNATRLDMAKTVQKTDDAVGIHKSGRQPKHWYVAIVNNHSEKLIADELVKRIKNQKEDEKDYEVYVAVQKEMRVLCNGKRKQVERIIFPALIFIYCTDLVRRKEIAYLPYIKRFMVNIAGAQQNGHRPVAVIPERQMIQLKRMVNDAENPVVFDSRPLHLGKRVRVNGGKLMGLEGHILQCSDGSINLVIMIDILGCAKVNITRDMLDLIE